MMKVLKLKNLEEVRKVIKVCQGHGHIQQVAYSTYHDTLTQVCFTCEEVTTNMEENIIC